MEESNEAPVPSPQETQHEKKRIYRGSLELETTDFDSAADGLEALVTECGGYFQSSGLYDSGNGYRSGDYMVRVPVEQYRSFFDRAGTLCHLRWKNEETEDVTRLYYDTDGRLKTQETKLARLQELLARAESMEDIITLESAISDTEYQIEQLSGELRYYDDQVAYSTVSITIREVYKLSGDQTPPEGFGDRLGKAFSNGLRSFLNGVEDGVVWLAYNLLWVVLLAAAAVLAVRYRRKHRDPSRPRKKLFRQRHQDQE